MMNEQADFRPPVGTRVKLHGGETGVIKRYLPGLGNRMVEIQTDAGGTWPTTIDQLVGYADDPTRCIEPGCGELAVNVATKTGRAGWTGELMDEVAIDEQEFCAQHTPTGEDWTVRPIAPQAE